MGNRTLSRTAEQTLLLFLFSHWQTLRNNSSWYTSQSGHKSNISTFQLASYQPLVIDEKGHDAVKAESY